MQSWVQDLLACPACAGSLSLTRFDGGEREDGVFRCEVCANRYFLIDGIPRFVDESILDDSESYARFVDEHADRLRELLPDDSDWGIDPTEAAIADRTDQYFGYEWDRWRRWGWLTEEELPERNRTYREHALERRSAADFDEKAPLTDEELAQGVVLDGGCGNGRFTNQAREHGRTVGVDIGTPTVEAAHENLQDDSTVQIVQGDLLNLPFQPAAFDAVFTIGILQHTGDARRAFHELATTVKPERPLTAHVYHTHNPIFEFNDAWIRNITTDLSERRAIQFARVGAALARTVDRLHPSALPALNLLFKLKPTTINMYDWYTAPIATHHTYGELLQWCTEAGLRVAETRMPEDYGTLKRIFLMPNSGTVKAYKPDDG